MDDAPYIATTISHKLHMENVFEIYHKGICYLHFIEVLKGYSKIRYHVSH